MKDTWAFGLLFSTVHLLFGLGIVWVQALSVLPGLGSLLPTWPMSPSFPCLWVGWCFYHATALLLLWYHLSFYFVVTSGLTGWSSCYDTTYLFTSLLPLGLRPKATTSPFLTFFLLLGFTGQHSCLASLFHPLGFLGPFHSLGFLGPLHSLDILNPFHSSGFLVPFSSFLPLSLSWVFAKSFRLPQPDYHILISYYLLGL